MKASAAVASSAFHFCRLSRYSCISAVTNAAAARGEASR
jgi:hypothetical protein